MPSSPAEAPQRPHPHCPTHGDTLHISLQARAEALGAVLAAVGLATPSIEQLLKERQPGRGRLAVSEAVEGARSVFALSSGLSERAKQVRGASTGEECKHTPRTVRAVTSSKACQWGLGCEASSTDSMLCAAACAHFGSVWLHQVLRPAGPCRRRPGRPLRCCATATSAA